MAGPSRTTRGPRADALRNRQRVVQAASEIFAERGIRASVADVAARAGVGNATVYRSYPTKTELLAEVALLWLEQMERDSAAAAGADDPVAAFDGLIEIVFERLRCDRLAADLLREGNLTDAVAATRRRVEANWTTALRRAAEAGAVRDDITYADLSVLILGTAERLSEMGVTDPTRWWRTAEFVRAAVAAPPPASSDASGAAG
ncbi:MAG TPA: TetR family transcriptional regulator [Solirubrobacteraceae bacterium]|nr:TetR family transcriptional regulator [Solirubrobacteraceae bacterium]